MRHRFRRHFNKAGASMCSFTARTHEPSLVSDWDLVDCKWCFRARDFGADEADLSVDPHDGFCRLCDKKAFWTSGWYSGLCPDCAVHEAVKATLRISADTVLNLHVAALVDAAWRVVRGGYLQEPSQAWAEVSPSLLNALEEAVKGVSE